ncbi:MAG: hypothetical protein J5J06_19530 [Phycisphaerae bacterium]|nr:hypothetical protein [Phycisphaerae bacterium]
MSERADNSRPAPRRFALALCGLLLALLSPMFWAMTINDSFLRWTALGMWLAMGAGLVAAIAAGWRDRRLRTRITSGLTLAWCAFAVVGFFVFTRLPEPTQAGNVEGAWDVVLQDQHGEATSLRELLRDGPVLLTFYRGFW